MKKRDCKAAFEKYNRLLCFELDKEYPETEEFEFSEEFEQRMQKLFEKRKKPHTAVNRWIVSAAAVLCITVAVMSFPSARMFIREKLEWAGLNEISYVGLTRVESKALSREQLENYNGAQPYSHFYYTDYEKLAEEADCIAVATAKDTFLGSGQVWKDENGRNTDSFESADIEKSYTERVFEIEKVYKGESITEAVVREAFITDGNKLLCNENDFIVKKGEKYLLFLFDTDKESEYSTALFSGKYSLDEISEQSFYEKFEAEYGAVN